MYLRALFATWRLVAASALTCPPNALTPANRAFTSTPALLAPATDTATTASLTSHYSDAISFTTTLPVHGELTPTPTSHRNSNGNSQYGELADLSIRCDACSSYTGIATPDVVMFTITDTQTVPVPCSTTFYITDSSTIYSTIYSTEVYKSVYTTDQTVVVVEYQPTPALSTSYYTTTTCQTITLSSIYVITTGTVSMSTQYPNGNGNGAQGGGGGATPGQPTSTTNPSNGNGDGDAWTHLAADSLDSDTSASASNGQTGTGASQDWITGAPVQGSGLSNGAAPSLVGLWTGWVLMVALSGIAMGR
jgi:hypothetical protein